MSIENENEDFEKTNSTDFLKDSPRLTIKINLPTDDSMDLERSSYLSELELLNQSYRERGFSLSVFNVTLSRIPQREVGFDTYANMLEAYNKDPNLRFRTQEYEL